MYSFTGNWFGKDFEQLFPGLWNLLQKYSFRVKTDYMPILQIWPLASGHFPTVFNLGEPQDLESDAFLKKEEPPYKNAKCPTEVFLDICSSRGNTGLSRGFPFLVWVVPSLSHPQCAHHRHLSGSSFFLFFLQGTGSEWKSYFCVVCTSSAV